MEVLEISTFFTPKDKSTKNAEGYLTLLHSFEVFQEFANTSVNMNFKNIVHNTIKGFFNQCSVKYLSSYSFLRILKLLIPDFHRMRLCCIAASAMQSSVLTAASLVNGCDSTGCSCFPSLMHPHLLAKDTDLIYF